MSTCLLWTYTATSPIFEKDGIFIQDTGEIRRVGAAWSLVVILQEPQTLLTEHLNTQITDAFTVASKKLGDKGIRVRYQEWKDLMQDLLKEITLSTGAYTEDAALNRRRLKRGLFNIIGRWVRPLFNIPDFTDIEALRKLIFKNNNHHEQLKHHMDEMITMINNTRDLVRENANHIELVNNQTNTVLTALLNDANATHNSITALRVYRTLNDAVMHAERIVKRYIHELKHYHKQKTDIERGWLTERVLNQKQLASILLQIGNRGFTVLPYQWYYQYISIDPIWEGEDHLAFRAMLPALDDQVFIQYTLNYMPVPFGEEHMRVIQGRDKVAIHTMTKASFVPSDCVGKNPVVCWPDIEKLGNSCESQLVSGTVPKSCSVKIVKSEGTSSTVMKVQKGDSMVLIAPTQVQENTVLRCSSKIPLKIVFNKPTIYNIPDACILESDTWRIVNVQHVHTSIRQEQRTPAFIPSINISWPTSVHINVSNTLKYIDHVHVPVIKIQKWEEDKNQVLDIEDIVTHPYVASGSGSVALIISLIVLGINVYMFCIKGRRNNTKHKDSIEGGKTSNTTIVTVPNAQPTAPISPVINQTIPLLPQLPPAYATAQSHNREMTVTITPEQIANIMGMGAQDTRPRASFAIQDDMY